MSTIQRQTTKSFEVFTGVCAILAGIAGFLYSFAFIVLLLAGKAPELGALLFPLFLTLLGLFALAALVAVYIRLRETDAASPSLHCC